MSQKHYDIHYLEDTFKGLKELKAYSYQPFLSIQEGTVLDLGCGTGIDIRTMASTTQHATTFIGIDHDAAMIQKANEEKGNVAHVQFMNREVAPLPFEDNSISGIRAERLFQHLQQPEKVWIEIDRVLLPEAPLVIVETDWDSISFYNTEPAIEQRVRQYLVGQKVKQGKVAKQLTGFLDKHQFKNIKLQLFPMVLHSFKEACTYLWIDKIIDEMLAQNILSASQHDLFLKNLTHADEGGYFGGSINMVIASATK